MSRAPVSSRRVLEKATDVTVSSAVSPKAKARKGRKRKHVRPAFGALKFHKGDDALLSKSDPEDSSPGWVTTKTKEAAIKEIDPSSTLEWVNADEDINKYHITSFSRRTIRKRQLRNNGSSSTRRSMRCMNRTRKNDTTLKSFFTTTRKSAVCTIVPNQPCVSSGAVEKVQTSRRNDIGNSSPSVIAGRTDNRHLDARNNSSDSDKTVMYSFYDNAASKDEISTPMMKDLRAKEAFLDGPEDWREDLFLDVPALAPDSPFDEYGLSNFQRYSRELRIRELYLS